MADYVLSIDQSTQGTKALLFDHQGRLICRTDLPHRQIINDQGWVSHDPEEIWTSEASVMAEALAELRKVLGPEDDEHDNQNDYELGNAQT